MAFEYEQQYQIGGDKMIISIEQDGTMMIKIIKPIVKSHSHIRYPDSIASSPNKVEVVAHGIEVHESVMEHVRKQLYHECPACGESHRKGQ